MIDVKSLRLGNLLNHKDIGSFCVLGIEPHCGDFKITTDKSWVYLKKCDPIPLSEGLLVAAGLWCKTPLDNGSIHLENMVGRYKYGECFEYVVDSVHDEMGGWAYVTVVVSTFHQLQNLYFSLLREELSFDLSLVGAGLGDSLSQPPAAEAMRGADYTATQDVERATDLYSDEPAMTASGGDYRAMPLGEFTDLPIDGEGFTVVSSDSAITSESREADGGKLPIDSESGKEVSWQETARNFMEESGCLKAENGKLRELLRLKERFSSLNRRYYDLTLTKEEETEIEKVYARISELRSELGLDK